MIFVLAGVNGAGKSSIGGSAIRDAGGEWYNPDEFARQLQQQFPEVSIRELNSRVWHEGRHRLEQAIRDDRHFAFETTLGGNSITRTLLDAVAAGVPVSVWYCGLQSLDLYLERVAARVARGGHDIPADLIRARQVSSMRNLCRLAPGLRRLAVDDNSAPLDEKQRPQVRRLLHVYNGEILELDAAMPGWAKPVAAVCLGAAARRDEKGFGSE